jgi:hypothetical protein
MKGILAIGIGVLAMGVSWILGGPFGGALNAPGLFLLGAARALEILPRFPERDLAAWIRVGTILSGAFWTAAAYGAIGFAGTRARRARIHNVR